MAGTAHEHEREARGRAAEAAPEREERGPLERLASGIGNRAFAALARDGSGILPDGRAHPDVEAAIARTRGGGQPLDDAVRTRVGDGLGDDLGDVRIHTDDHADALSRSVQARAFTTGSDVYFAKGEYQPGSSAGDRLLAHELTHVVQQRGAPVTGPLTVSQPGDTHEVEAEKAADDLAG
ncbi:MAG: DUF4157 domain-containing protein [Actinomycetota bacterium]